MSSTAQPDPAADRLMLSKYGLATRLLARLLLESTTGQRIPSMQSLASQHDLSLGTIQAALDALQSGGAASLAARGRLGTFVQALDYAALWIMAERRSMRGCLPLPYSRRFEGLATALRECYAADRLDLELRFVRGAASRIAMLEQGQCDWACVSRYAADMLIASSHPIDLFLTLAPGSYMAGHVIIARNTYQPWEAGSRVGIDPQSLDHRKLVEMVTDTQPVQLVEIEYSLGLQHIHTGLIDATIWSSEDLPQDTRSLQIIPIQPTDFAELTAMSQAAFVMLHGQRSTRHVLGQVANLTRLHQVQEQVIQRTRLPQY